MNRILVLAGTAIAAIAVAATAQTPAAPTEDRDSGQLKVVCKSISEIGSRLNRRRVCRTRAQWEEVDAQTRQVVERVQSTKTTSGN